MQDVKGFSHNIEKTKHTRCLVTHKNAYFVTVIITSSKNNYSIIGILLQVNFCERRWSYVYFSC